jgi:hypothetical protein
MDDPQIEKLKAVNRELATFLKDQLEYLLTLNLSVLAIQKVLEGDSVLSARYKACLQSVKGAGPQTPNPQRVNHYLGVLDKIQLTGTL